MLDSDPTDPKSMPGTFEIQFNPVYLAEARASFTDLDAAVREAIPWVIMRIAIARSCDELQRAFDELSAGENVFRAILGCEILGLAASRPDVREWLCRYLAGMDLSDGARYQLAGACSRLGVEARRANRLPEAIAWARKGIEAVADLPSCAVTANLYYNLGVALDAAGDVHAAIHAFQDAAEIDELLERPDDAAQSQQRITELRGQT